MIKTILAHRNDATIESAGFIPLMLDESDPRSAREQLHTNYAHGGGWLPTVSFELADNDVLLYPEDPPYYPILEMRLRDERIVLYDYSFVAIIQQDRSFEVARMD